MVANQKRTKIGTQKQSLKENVYLKKNEVCVLGLKMRGLYKQLFLVILKL